MHSRAALVTIAGMEAYEQMIQETATKEAPWYVVPADSKWFTRVVVAAAVVDTLTDLDLAYPKVDEGKRKELATAKGTFEKVTASRVT